MSTITLGEFLGLVRAHDVFRYNQRTVEASFGAAPHALTGGMVLDVGAGPRLKHFAQQIKQARFLVGVDYVFDDVRQNRDVDARVVGDAARLPFAGGIFDCILTVDVVEHLPQPDAFLREAARCLRPGGRVFICTPNLLGYKNVVSSILPRPALDLAWRVFKGRVAGQPHRTFYRANTHRRMRQLATAAGLVVERANYLDEVSHFFYTHPVLSVLTYLYGRGLRALHLAFLLNYSTYILRKPARAEQAVMETGVYQAPQARPARASVMSGVTPPERSFESRQAMKENAP